MRMPVLRPVLAVVVLATGCATTTTLQPLPSTPTTAAGTPLAQKDGVQLVANGAAWKGNPSDLGRIITPVQVRLENHSDRPLRVNIADFTLEGGSSHFDYAPLSLLRIRQDDSNNTAIGGSGPSGSLDVAPGVVQPAAFYGHHRFGYGYGGWGPGFYGWGGFYDPFYSPYAYWYRPEPLPTQDMVRSALPEGTLQPGGALTGFLYFQSVGAHEGQVTLRARLVDARTGDQFGTLDIPFQVEG